MKPLETWSPKFLTLLYTEDLERLEREGLTLNQKEAFTKKVAAIYRLGTYLEMKDIWSKLLAKEAKSITNPYDKEQALVGRIHELVWLSQFGGNQPLPSDRKNQLGEISKKIKELQKLMKKSGEASYEDKGILETILHKRNVEYRKQNGENIGTQSPNYLKFIDGNANAELQPLPLDEHMPWLQRSRSQRLGWWTRESQKLSLTDILGFYSERMGDYSTLYKQHYQRDKPKLIRGLQRLMSELYGSPLDEYVGGIVSVILDSKDKGNSRDTIRSYRKRKTK